MFDWLSKKNNKKYLNSMTSLCNYITSNPKILDNYVNNGFYRILLSMYTQDYIALYNAIKYKEKSYIGNEIILISVGQYFKYNNDNILKILELIYIDNNHFYKSRIQNDVDQLFESLKLLYQK